MFLAALAALSLSAAPAPPKPFTLEASIEGLTEYRLPNGLRVLFVPDSSKPTVTVNLTVFVGSRMENYGEKGMAHLFEHMLFKKTKKIPDLKEAITEHGGDANGTTDYDRTNYYEVIPASDANLQWAVGMEAERLVNAIISRDQLATEMTVVRNEFEMGENQPQAVLLERTLSAAFVWHSYGDAVIGARSDIENVPTEKLKAFYEQWYQPDNAMLVIAGRFDEARAFKFIADSFGKLPRPKRALPSTYTVEPTQDGEHAVTVRRVGGTPVLNVGYHVPAGSDPDYAAIDVLDRVLGDAPSGRVYKELVDTKKAAKASCENLQQREPGFFICWAELRAGEPTAPARDAMVGVIEGLAKKPVTPEEVERAKRAILKNFDLELNSSERVGLWLSEFAAMGDWRLMFLHRDRVKAVTADDVMRVAQKYFKPSNRTVGEYVPTEKPDRAEIPALVDLAPIVKTYKGAEGLSAGENFDASPKNLDARTTRSALPNGLKLALLPKKTRGETVHLTLHLDYGTDTSLANLRAAGSFAARMLSRGTKTKTRQQFKDEVDKLKLALSFEATPQALSVIMEVRRPQLAAALDLVAEALKEPAFDAREFETLRGEQLTEYEQRRDDPDALGSLGLSRAMSPFPKGHPLYVATYEELIAEATALELEQVRSFHGRFYGAQAGLVAVVGDFDAKEVTEKLTAHLGAWSAKENYERIPVPFKPVEPKTLVTETPDKAMAFFGAGTSFPLKELDPEFAAVKMADFMLGGGFLNGRVPRRLREKDGLCYGAGTTLQSDGRDDNTVLLGFAISAPQNAGKVERGFREELTLAVDKGFTEEELKLARQGLLQQREQERADESALTGDLVEQLDLGRTMAFEQALDDKLKALSARDVGAALKKYVDPKKLVVVKAGDFKKAGPLR